MNRLTIVLLSLLVLSSCRESVFTAKVEKIDEPEEVIDVTAEKIESDYLYTQFFAVYDTLLISSCPNKPEYNFYVSSLKDGRLLGSFMRRGQGPDEFLGLTPISRIEHKGDDLTAITYGPFNHQLMEWNITKSLEMGRDSIVRLGYYKDPNEYGFTYAKMYRIGDSEYLGYTSGRFTGYHTEPLLPTYWILEGAEITPVKGISVVKRAIQKVDGDIVYDGALQSAFSLSPDNFRIINVMEWLEQINIIDLTDDKVSSYRVKSSPGESIFDTYYMKSAERQYYDVVCNDSAIYALYVGEPTDKLAENHGAFWIHKYDWDGKFIAKYHLPVPILRLWLDSSNNTLYGYNEKEDVIYRLNIDI